MRFLAIDPGDRRTGLALGDDEMRIVTPLPPIVTSKPTERLNQLARAIDEQGPDALVVGLPLNMDGSEGPPAAAARRFAGELQARFGLPVHLADERLTSAVADGQMAGSDLTHGQKKRRRDGLAAAAILRDFLGQWDGKGDA